MAVDPGSIMDTVLSALAGGGATVAAGWKVLSALIDKAISNLREETKTMVKESNLEIRDKLDDMVDKINECSVKCEILEKSDNQTQLNLLKNMHDLADRTADWREKLRAEFINQDALELRVMRIINEHCKNCSKGQGLVNEHYRQCSKEKGDK
jgi:hypothetical protein